MLQSQRQTLERSTASELQIGRGMTCYMHAWGVAHAIYNESVALFIHRIT